MTAKELMVGDWVKMNSGPARITAIKEGEIHFVDKVGRGISFDCEGLPLTPEILEKNGFVKQGFPGWEIYTEDFLILWRNDYPDVLEIRSFNAACGSFHRSHIGAVHELQHALRLCGIEKEITL